MWNDSESDDALRVVKFLVDAGADHEFEPSHSYVHTCLTMLIYSLNGLRVSRYSAKSLILRCSFATLVENPKESFTQRVRSSSIAINICQSALGVDILDVAEDALAQDGYTAAQRAALGFCSETITSSNFIPDGQATLQQLTGLTPLEFAITNMLPERILEFLQRADATEGAPLAYAVKRGNIALQLMGPLLDSGAKVNALDRSGRSAVHWISWYSRTGLLKMLIGLAGDKIDWTVRTGDDNQSALQLAKASQYWYRRSPAEREELLAILSKYGDEAKEGESNDDADLDVSSTIPGAFPTT